MAVWQYSFWTIPKDSLVQKYGNVPKKITENDFNDLIWFDKFNKNNLIKKINFLPSNTHWNDTTLFWGTYESDSIAITIEHSFIRDIYIRIDLRNNYILMLEKIIELLSTNGLYILDEELNIIAPELDEIINKIELYIIHMKNYFKSILK